ncbi:MAG: hypothetical protein ACHQ7M_19830, partial [Chloroflexota bacterium]
MVPVILAGDNMTPVLHERAQALGVPIEVATVHADGAIEGDTSQVQVLLAAGTLNRPTARAFLREHQTV